MSRLRKRITNYQPVKELKVLGDSISSDASSNLNLYFLKELLGKVLSLEGFHIFSKNKNLLINTENFSWTYKKEDDHPFFYAFQNRGVSLYENIENDLSFNKDLRLKENYDFRQIKIYTQSFEHHLIVMIFPRNAKLSSFQENFIGQIESFISLNNKVLSQYDYLENMSDLIIQAISKKDTYTGGHTKRVGMFAKMICEEIGCSDKFQKEVTTAAVIHDIGKIGIPDHILKKTSPLTDEEFEVMKTHPTLGEEILKKIPGFETISKGVSLHHERPDGKGYPYGLKGEEIPLIARIVSLSDAFDAMISTRPYRKAITPDQAFESLRLYRGSQFDAEIFDAFEQAFLKSNLSKKYRELKKVG